MPQPRPQPLPGLSWSSRARGTPLRFAAVLAGVTGDGFSPREVRVNGRPLPTDRHADNPYRRGGLLISKHAFGEALDQAENLVEIFI